MNRIIQAFTTPKLQQTAVDQIIITTIGLLSLALVLALFFFGAWALDELRRRQQIKKAKKQHAANQM